MLKALRYGLILLAGIGVTSLMAANNRTTHTIISSQPPVQEDTSKKIHIINADNFALISKDSVNERRFRGNVIFRQSTSMMYCDSAVFNQAKNMIEAWGRVHINQDDSIHTYSDYLIYMGDTRIATLTGNAKLTDNKIVLTSPEIQYDMNTKIGTYTKSGKLVNEKSVLTSQEGFYYAETKDVYFKKDVVIIDPGFTLSTDTLLYNSTTKIATILAPTTINDGKMTMFVTKGYYNTDIGYGSFSDRPIIEDSTNTFTANDIQTDKASGISIATGNMIWRDTAQKVSVLANYGIVNQFNKTVLATRKPVMLLEGKNDTLLVAADTLFSGIIKIDQVVDSAVAKPDSGTFVRARLTDSSTLVTDSGTLVRAGLTDSGKIVRADSARKTAPAAAKDTTEKRFLIAYNHVKIYSDSLQGVADSVYYSGVDSIFRLYKDPVLWANGNQLFGDTIFLFTKNQKADKLLLDQNAMIINEAGPGMYNQVKGNTVLGFFGEEKMDSMYVNGNAENIYYVQDDDSAFISINRLLSAATHIYFENGELERIVFLKEAEATMYPFTQMPEEQKKLPGFKWVIERKPRSKYELLGQ